MKEYFEKRIILDAVYHAKEEFPNESCGFFIKKDGKMMYFPQKNISKDKNLDFEIDIREYLKYEKDIECIIHSHSNYPHASKKDMLQQFLTHKPWGIINLINESLDQVVFWGDQLEPQDLIGRRFFHGIYDCYSLVRDYYRFKGIVLPIHERENLWWETDPSMLEDNVKDAGFKRIPDEDVKEGDVVFMKINANVVNHSGIVLSNGLVLHHLYNRLSTREPLNRWRQYISGYYRRT